MSAEFDLHALDKKEIRQQVFEQLLSQITTGKWKPGEKIPSENELTSIMGVSASLSGKPYRSWQPWI